MGSDRSINGTANPHDLFDSPPDALDFNGDDSAYLGFDVDGDFDENFDLNDEDDEENTSHDLHEKRKSMDGRDDDDEEGGGKRREGEDKSGKKPGRKPLTSEPTSKRKAQNRAAQRAFRERKEKHLKDLEAKVEDLEKASESTTHENGLLRAQVERLQVELKEYRKRLSWVSSNGLSKSQPATNGPNSQSRNSNSMNDFHFEFPKFGDLPAMPSLNNGVPKNRVNSGPAASSSLPANGARSASASNVARNSLSSASPQSQRATYNSTGQNNSPASRHYSASPTTLAQPSMDHQNSIDSLSGLFSPSILEASRNSAYGYFSLNQSNNAAAYRGSLDKGIAPPAPNMYASSSNTDSPASSSDSQQHHSSSSMGTSPEPSFNSPHGKQNDFALNAISEDQPSGTFAGEMDFCQKLALACGSADDPVPAMMKESNDPSTLGSAFTSGYDANSFNWLAQQNGGSFDPVLFGDYRETQDNVVSQDFGSFFNDAFPLPDLGSPQHNFNDVAPEPSPKADLMKQVDAVQDGEEEVVPGEDRAKLMTCNKIWDRLQSMEKFRNGEIDVDNLCSELRAKARCSEGGAVVEEKDFNKIVGDVRST